MIMPQDPPRDAHDASDSEEEDVFYDALYPPDEEAVSLIQRMMMQDADCRRECGILAKDQNDN